MSHSWYVLEIHYVGGRPPEQRTIVAQRTVIGRDTGVDIAIADPKSSATHAEIEFEDGQLVVRDLGSKNGTWKADRALPQFAVSEGESFRCADTVFRVLQVVGGKAAKAGGTVMGDEATLAAVRAQMGQPAGAPAPAVTVPAKRGPPVAAIVGAAVGVVAVGSVVAFFALRSGDTDEVAPTEIAQVEPPAPEPEPEAKAPEPEPETKAPPEPPGPPTPEDLGAIYKKVGSATVVIRTPGSVGSGAVVDPRGVILTNHHVIVGGRREGLKIKVQVTLGKFNEELAAFEPQSPAVDAYVLKMDEAHDLALIELVAPPKELASIAIAAKPPYPGQNVAAIGHAGAGMLWAIKGGEISATGSLAGHADLALEESKGPERELIAKIKAKLEKHGRVIQSTARILPGDSGGPLVNLQGEIVGLNAFGRIDQVSGEWLSFHVHQAELVKFCAQIPKGAQDIVPDPWVMVDGTPQRADVDLDGTDDTVVVMGEPRGGTLLIALDLDQDALPADQEPDKLAETLQGGKLGEAYRIAADGGVTADRSAVVDDGFDAKPFASSAVRDRFAVIAPVVLPGLASERTGTHGVPDPLAKVGGRLSSHDGDGDGRDESFTESTMFHSRMFWDADQNTGGFGSSGFQRAIEGKRADVEVVALLQGRSGWVWTDSNDDGRFDLLFETRNVASGAAHAAFVIGPTGALTASAEHLGRRLVRAALVPDAAQGKRLAAGATATLGAHAVATDDGLGSFPSLDVDLRATVVVGDALDVKNAVVTATDFVRDVVLVDVDGSSTKGKDRGAVETLARGGKLDAEFALVTTGGAQWAFYDTDGKGGFDRVIVASTPGSDTPTAAFDVKADKASAIATGSSLVQWGAFTNKGLRAAFSRIAPALFPGRAREG
jgi:S1-C subfamily serine protease